MNLKKKYGEQSLSRLYRRLGIRYVSLPLPERAEPLSHAPMEIPKPGSEVTVPLDEKRDGKILAPPSWLTTMPDTLEAMELKAFDQDICHCQKCPLGAIRKNFVFGSGNPQARVLFVGEAPGADEDAAGLPFVGRAGQLLTKIIESTQTWKRSEVFIGNVLKCRPPSNRTPLPKEIEECKPYLEEQIQIIKPQLLMALGAVAAQALLQTTQSVGQLRHRWHDYQGIPLRVTYHPAALLRQEGYKKDVWQDMKEFTAKYKELQR